MSLDSRHDLEWLMWKGDGLESAICQILTRKRDRMQVTQRIMIAAACFFLSIAIVTVADAQHQSIKTEAPLRAAVSGSDASGNHDPKSEASSLAEANQRANSISIQGTVHNGDGEIVRWSEVWLVGMANNPGTQQAAVQLDSVRADKNGQFEFWHPPWQIDNPRPDEYTNLCVIGRTRDGTLTSIASLDLLNEFRGRKEIHGIKLTTLPKGNYRGRVVDGDGKPISNAKVIPQFLILKSPPPKVKSAVMTLFPELADRFTVATDANGSFTLFGLPEASHVQVKVSIASTSDREFLWLSNSTPELRMERGGTIRGKLANLPADDLADQFELMLLIVHLGRLGPPEVHVRYTTRVRAQMDGSFEFNDVPPGQYMLRISPARRDFVIPNEWHAAGIRCESRSDEITDGIELPLMNAIATRGRVIDAKSGEGIAGATVSFWVRENPLRVLAGNSTTDANGEYRAYLRPGHIGVEVTGAPTRYLISSSDALNSLAEHDKDFESPTFQLERAITFRGTVVDTQGVPVSGAEVICLKPGKMGTGLPQKILSDETGQFEISQVHPREALPIRVRNSIGVARQTVIPVAELTENRPIEVSPANAFRIKGTVVDQFGHSVVNARVMLDWHSVDGKNKENPSGWMKNFDQDKTDEQGRFETSPLWGTDNYYAVIEVDGFDKKDLPLVKGKAAEIYDYGTVKMTRTSQTISGRVVDTEGTPLENIEVFSRGKSGQNVSTVSDAEGRFRLKDLLVGTSYLFASNADYRFAGTYTIDPSVEVLLTLSRRTASPPQRKPVDFAAVDAVRKKQADELGTWMQAADLPFKPNIRDSQFKSLARTDPEELLVQIGKQPPAVGIRSALLVSRSLMPVHSLKRISDEQAKTDAELALRLIKRAAARIDDLNPRLTCEANADVGLMMLRSGENDRGKTLIEAAAKEWSESNAEVDSIAATIVQGLARYDGARALRFREKIKSLEVKEHVGNRFMIEHSTLDIPRAVELLKKLLAKHPKEEFYNDQLKMDLAWRIGPIAPQTAAGLVSRIEEPRIQAEASGWTAVSVSETNPELARSLIDLGLETMQLNRQPSSGPPHDYIPGMAGNLLVNAAQIDHPELVTLIQKVMALRIPPAPKNPAFSRFQSTLDLALCMAFVEPAIARQMLIDLDFEVDERWFGDGVPHSISRRHWLCAWVVADPEKGAKLLRAEMEKPTDEVLSPSWIESALTLLNLPHSEQLDYIRQHLQTNLMKPYMD